MIERDDLAEWAVVHGRRYGTPRREVTSAIERGRSVVLDIDVQGARQLRRVFSDAVLIFILPPSARELDRRLTGRSSENSDERHRRLRNARREIGAASEFDFVVVNDDLERAIGAVESIIVAEGARVARMSSLESHTHGLLHDLDALISQG